MHRSAHTPAQAAYLVCVRSALHRIRDTGC